MIACSNIKGQNYSNLNKRSTENAKWENLVSLHLQPGDTINVENTTLNLRGISSDSTVELLNQDNEHGVSDSKTAIRFTAYVNDNGQNTIALPCVGATQEVTYPITNVNNYPLLTGLKTSVEVGDGDHEDTNFYYICPQASQTNPDDNTAPYNPQEPKTDDSYYQFVYYQGATADPDTRNHWNTPFHDNLKTIYTEKPAQGTWNSVSGHKYTVVDENYLGPYPKDTNRNFWSAEDDFKPQYFTAKVDLNAPLYESPSTIAADVNNQLNDTDVYAATDSTLVRDQYSSAHQLPSLTGSLLKVRKVNGFIDYDYDDAQDPNQGRKKLWGNLAVRDFKKWEGIHYLMRTELAFNNEIDYNGTTRKIYTPVFTMAQGNIDGKVYYPRTAKEFKFKTGLWFADAEPIGQEQNRHVYYTTLPQYFVMTTNMKYTEDNVRLIAKYMQNMERYDGDWTENLDQDIMNWRVHFDIGMSRQAPATNNDTEQMYHMGQGDCDFAFNDEDNPDDFKDMQYVGSTPYFPFKEDDDDVILSTSRSDIADLGYAQMLPSSLFGMGNINTITEEVPHRFKDNKNQDASIAVFSKYDAYWKEKAPTYNDMVFGDDTYSKQYGIACYPVSTSINTEPDNIVDLVGTYWRGFCNNLPEKIAVLNYYFYFKIEKGEDADHQQYGGYSMYYLHSTGGSSGSETWQWVHMDDMYIYSSWNSTVHPDRDPIDNLQFDGQYNISDLDDNPNWFVLDYANDKRWAMAFWDKDDLSHSGLYYCEPGFNETQNPYFPDEVYHDFAPMGEYPFQEGGHYYDVRITDMYVASSDPDSGHYSPGSGVNDQLPIIGNPDNPQDTVCAFLLYRDSATENSDGTYTISTDFALPSMHQAQFCVSPSFMDNPAVWLTNASRFDDVDHVNGSANGYDFMTVHKNINYMVVGANNPTFQWDDDLSRCSFSNLHITKRLGVEDMPTDDNGDVITSTIGKEVVKVADQKIKNGYLYNLLKVYDSEGKHFTGNGPNQNYLLNYSISGISFDSVYGEPSNENNTTVETMTQLTESNWSNSLLYKLGFSYDDLFHRFGLPTNVYDQSKIKSKDPSVRYEKLKPLTTNPLIDISSAIDLPIRDATFANKEGEGDPTYTLSVGSLIPTNLDGSVSEQIVASQLPIKQATPYYLIYCNLGNGNFIQNTDTFNIIGICDKKFIAGDFVYGSANDPIQVKMPQKVSKIEIEIRDNKGEIVSLDDNSTVLLRLVRNPSQ